MMRILTGTLLLLTLLLSSVQTFAVTGVNPSGVNVRSSGSTTVFLTFQNLETDEQPLEAFWCGDLVLSGGPVFNSNPCDPSTIFGRLPARLNRSTVSGAAGFRNLTDIMTIPASVSRRAFQEALRGRASQFFYVRRFSSGVFVAVTCRMAGGGARVPLALIDVRIGFKDPDGSAVLKPIYNVTRSGELPPFGAQIKYNGSGRLRGRWEVTLPGDTQPSERDLLTEATLPVEERGLQRRFTLLERFEVFLTPIGEVFIPGPKFNTPPTEAGGLHKILLRIEASDDREGNSNIGGGLTVNSGGVAGFPMPVLRYFVGSSEQISALQSAVNEIKLMLPGDQAFLAPTPVEFTWIDISNAAFYRVEVEDDNGPVVEALIKPGVSSYTAPPWLQEKTGVPLRWRVVSMNNNGNLLAASSWRSFQIGAQ